MESQLRRSASLCRRMAGGALLLGGVGAIAIAALFAREPDEGPFFAQALLTIMFALLTSLALALLLFLAVARTMDGVADLLADRAPPPASEPAPALPTPAGAPTPGREGASHDGSGPATHLGPGGEATIGRPTPAHEVKVHIRWGHFVKVTTPDGATGWVRDTDLPVTRSTDPSPAS